MNQIAPIRLTGIFLALFGLAASPATPQSMSVARNVVSPAAYPSYDPVARGHEMHIAVVLKIREGYHVNARRPTLDYLIPTDLKVEAPAGFHPGEIVYPKGELKTFTFSKDQPLNVYQGTVILRFPVSITPEAPIGVASLPMKLRYQACSQTVCLPPVTLHLSATVKVVGSSSAARQAHANLFPPHP
jgi:DsbC/DsbD-like thiol-disulfide interchange protein